MIPEPKQASRQRRRGALRSLPVEPLTAPAAGQATGPWLPVATADLLAVRAVAVVVIDPRVSRVGRVVGTRLVRHCSSFTVGWFTKHESTIDRALLEGLEHSGRRSLGVSPRTPVGSANIHAMASNTLSATDKGDYIEVDVPADNPLVDRDISEWNGIAHSCGLVEDMYEVRERRHRAGGAVVLIFKLKVLR